MMLMVVITYKGGKHRQALKRLVHKFVGVNYPLGLIPVFLNQLQGSVCVLRWKRMHRKGSC